MEGIIFGLIGILVSIGSTDATLIILPQKTVLFVREGRRLELHCQQSYESGTPANDEVVLKKGNVNLEVTSPVIDGIEKTVTYTYVKDRAEINDTDVYACILTRTGASSTLNVVIYRPPVFVDVVFNGTGLNQSCALKYTKSELHFDYSWTHNGVQVKADDRISIEEHQLQIKESQTGDMGEWVCTATFLGRTTSENLEILAGSFSIFVPPVIDTKHKESNLYLAEGDDLELKCKVSGFPPPDISWFRDDTNLSAFTIERFQILSYDGSETGRLKGYGLLPEDRGNYTCVASSYVNNTKMIARWGTYVRVKGRYAALWPAIGIAVELIVLFFIIWCSSRRRKSSDDDDDVHDGVREPEELDEASPETSVRHRLTERESN